MTSSDDADLERLVDRADLDALVRRIDALCSSRDWDELFRLRSLTRSAATTGRQLWPAATLSEYRLALLAPAMWASRVLREDASRFSIGPLTEVIAQNHTWADLEPHLEHGPQREFVAYERALRGDVVEMSPTVLDLPLAPQPWEPAYAFPSYGDGGVDHPSPVEGWHLHWSTPIFDAAPNTLVDHHTDDALRLLVEPWTALSSGRARALIVESDGTEALGLLHDAPIEVAPLDSRQALHWLVWCGASGGAHGRRRGMATGRFNAWWLLAAIGGYLEDWDDLVAESILADTIGRTSESLEWSRWRAIDRHGYELRLLAHDRSTGITVVLDAHDDVRTSSADSTAL